MMKFMKPIAMMIDGGFGNDAAEAIGVATKVLGSAITSIAAMKMVMALVPRMQAQKCRVSYAWERNAWARVSMDAE